MSVYPPPPPTMGGQPTHPSISMHGGFPHQKANKYVQAEAPPPRPPLRALLVRATVSVVSATVGTMFYFALFQYPPLSENQ